MKQLAPCHFQSQKDPRNVLQSIIPLTKNTKLHMKGTLLDLAKNRPDTESQVNERLEPSKRAPTKTRSDSQDNGLTLISLPNTTGQQIYEKLAHHTHTHRLKRVAGVETVRFFLFLVVSY